MPIKEDFAAARIRWRLLSVYQKFEHLVIMILTCLIAIVIAAAVWNLMLKILFSLVLAETFDPTDYVVFQTVFGMILTVVIALEFKRSLLVVAERREYRPGADGDFARDARHRPQADYSGSQDH